jgi:hypothetical protein
METAREIIVRLPDLPPRSHVRVTLDIIEPEGQPEPGDPCVGWCPHPDSLDCECERELARFDGPDDA